MVRVKCQPLHSQMPLQDGNLLSQLSQIHRHQRPCSGHRLFQRHLSHHTSDCNVCEVTSTTTENNNRSIKVLCIVLYYALRVPCTKMKSSGYLEIIIIRMKNSHVKVMPQTATHIWPKASTQGPLVTTGNQWLVCCGPNNLYHHGSSFIDEMLYQHYWSDQRCDHGVEWYMDWSHNSNLTTRQPFLLVNFTWHFSIWTLDKEVYMANAYDNQPPQKKTFRMSSETDICTPQQLKLPQSHHNNRQTYANTYTNKLTQTFRNTNTDTQIQT